MAAEVIPLLARRRIEAELLARVYRALQPRVGAQAALATLAEAVESAAEAAGAEFARQAPGGRPNLAHFAGVLERWRAADALSLADVRQGEATLEFRVTRCGYVDLYRALGLPAELAYTVSCCRDAAFARGYHPDLTLERSPTLAEGAAECRFRFSWATPA